MYVVLLGPPGVGKGTLSLLLAKKLDVPSISMGDIMRDHIKRKTPLGKKIQAILASGGLVDDSTTIALFRERIREPDCIKGFVSDGFPRTLAQAKALDLLVALDGVLNLIAPNPEIIKRITGRWTCPKDGTNYHTDYFPPKNDLKCDKCKTPLRQREDQKKEVVEKRLKVYLSITQRTETPKLTSK